MSAAVVETDLAAHAVSYAASGWAVLPLRPNKAPYARHGVLDASNDVDVVAGWWTRWPTALIGVRVPAQLLVLDVDPRHGGDRHLQALEAAHGPLPATLTVVSGRGDGGRHLYFLHPGGRPGSAGLRADLHRLQVLAADERAVGVDVKTSAGYVIVPPSPHPLTGRPYTWRERPPIEVPPWLRRLLCPPPPPSPARPPAARTDPYAGDPFTSSGWSGGSIADDYCASITWRKLLEPAGWQLVKGDGEADGSGWRHPTATSAVSATVRHACLFAYSPNAGLPLTEAGDPRGLTRFRAYAHLHHGGDLSGAARHLRATPGAWQRQVAA